MTVTTTQHWFVSTRIEPAVALALRSCADANTAASHASMRAALDAFRILGVTQPKDQPVVKALQQLERQLSSDTVQFHWTGGATCKIDADAIAATLRSAIENAALSGDAVLLVEFDSDAEPPQIELAFDGPGSFPDRWFVGGIIPIVFEELRLHWTRHTAGGRLDRTPNGLVFKLAGQREPPSNPKTEDDVLNAIVEAERMLRLASSTDAASPDTKVLQNVLDAIDAHVSAREPADLCALLRAVANGHERIDAQCGENIPPIAVFRERFAAALQRLCELAQSRLEAGASATLAAEYNSANCTTEIECAFPRAGNDLAWQAACAALERVIEHLHGGTALTELIETACNASLNIPDTIGAAVNAWIPGFDAFSERSASMLRLLKSGGQAPPEDLILPGVLESELERWLLIKLSEPPAVNVAHDLGDKHTPRLDKALSQIRRGKPKKEICAPNSAAEILRAFANDERGRRALGLEALEPGEIDSLLDALVSEPPGYITCLQLLAKIMRAASA